MRLSALRPILLVGVNSAIYTTGSDTGNVGIGLVIPINDAKMVMNQMKEVPSGKGVLAYMGAQVLSLTPDLAAAYGLPGPWGSIVVKVPDGTAAAPAKLRAGDIITLLDGRDMKVRSAACHHRVVTWNHGGAGCPARWEGDTGTRHFNRRADKAYGIFLD
jgi:hypothetical protein